MRTNRIRTTVAGLAAGLALSIAGTGVAAAAVVVHQPGPTVTSTNVVYTGPTVAEQVKGGATGPGRRTRRSATATPSPSTRGSRAGSTTTTPAM